jgi:isoleucyl-tRNA synthetase
MMGTLWNAYAFFVLYANIDGFNPTEHKLPGACELNLMDRWVLSQLNTLVKLVDKNMSEYRVTEAAREIADFTDGLSNWYIRRSRERFWAAGMESDKVNAYMTLYTVLVTMAELCAPFIPFMAEALYQNLVRSVARDAIESVHLCPFPFYNEGYINVNLEADMNGVQSIVERGRAARNTASVKNRQPLSMMYVKAGFTLPESYHGIILDELNVKQITFTDDVEGFSSYSFKPQLRTLGKKYGKLLPQIGEALAAESSGDFLARLKNGGVTMVIAGEEVFLNEEDVLVAESQNADFAADTGKGVTVALDIRLTPELIEEGFVNEIVSKLQNMRKEAGFDVTDKIRVECQTGEKLGHIINNNEQAIKSAVLAVEIVFNKEPGGFAKSWDINGEAAVFGVLKEGV